MKQHVDSQTASRLLQYDLLEVMINDWRKFTLCWHHDTGRSYGHSRGEVYTPSPPGSGLGNR